MRRHAYTYDDIQLVPSFSKVVSRKISVSLQKFQSIIFCAVRLLLPVWILFAKVKWLLKWLKPVA